MSEPLLDEYDCEPLAIAIWCSRCARPHCPRCGEEIISGSNSLLTCVGCRGRSYRCITWMLDAVEPGDGGRSSEDPLEREKAVAWLEAVRAGRRQRAEPLPEWAWKFISRESEGPEPQAA